MGPDLANKPSMYIVGLGQCTVPDIKELPVLISSTITFGFVSKIYSGDIDVISLDPGRSVVSEK